MAWRLCLLLVTIPACISGTAGLDTTPIVNSQGEPDVVSLGTFGFGYAFSQKSALNLEVDVGSSLRSPLVVGESISYTRIGPKRGWRVGYGIQARPLADGAISLRGFGQYLIPLRRRTSRTRSGGNKYTLFELSKTSYWTFAVGPEFSTRIDESDETRTAMGLGFRLGWFGMSGE